MKVCFAASSGGHMEQLMMLKPLMEKYDSFIVTEKTKYQELDDRYRAYYVKQVNRKDKDLILRLAWNTVYSFFIFLKERPDVVISTGVLATIPICMTAKLFHRKLIYLESFAKVTSPTQTGKYIYKHADQFYVQWESMKAIYPDAIYMGSVY